MLNNDSSIVIKTDRSDNSIAINIIPKGNIIKTDEEGIYTDEICQDIIKQLKGSISQKEEGVTITLPFSIT